MTDGIIKGNGASRYLKTIPSGLSQYPTYEDFMQALIEGTFPVDLFGRNPGGWTQEGTLLNKASLLTDETAAQYGFGPEATVNDVLSKMLVPVGSVFWLAAETAPTGYLICDGSSISRTDYAALFSVIGVKFGSGNGSTTFALPNLRAAFIRGAGSQSGYNPKFAMLQEATVIELRATTTSTFLYTYNADKKPSGQSFNTSNAGQTSGAGTSVRPFNLALTPIIKY